MKFDLLMKVKSIGLAVAGLVVAAGLLSHADVERLGQIGSALGGAALALWLAVGELWSFWKEKQGGKPGEPPTTPLALLLAPLVLLALTAPLPAQQVTPTCIFGGGGGSARIQQLEREVSNLRAELARKPQLDPALAAQLARIEAQLAAQDRQMLQLQRPPVYYWAPQQQLPIVGAPQQLLPIAGNPQQLLPIPGAPQHQLPIQGAPQQQLPIGGAPQQQLPQSPGPPQQQLPPQMPPPVTGTPQGYQRFTHAISAPVR